VKCQDSEDILSINLIDVSPPIIKITEPLDKSILNKEVIEIAGIASDNFGINRIEVYINDEVRIATGTHSWSINWDLTELILGDYKIVAKAFDKTDIIASDEIQVAINESGYSWGPIINEFYNDPQNPTNKSNVIIYANVTTDSPFNIDKVVLYWNNGSITSSNEMFRYGDNPIQERHEEDPLKHLSNEPIYGLELGQFPTGTNIIYWITAVDNANNIITSDEKSFNIGVKQSFVCNLSQLSKSSNQERSTSKLSFISNRVVKQSILDFIEKL
jgi:hypothetical protein